MKFTPFDVFTIQTELSIPGLMQRLERHVEPRQFVRGGRDCNDFEGWVASTGFAIKPIKPIVFSQTVFLPEVHGRFVPQGHGTTVIVQMIPNCAVLTILMLFACYLGFHIFDTQALRVLYALGSAAGMAWFFSLIGFWLDAGYSKRKLIEILSNESDAGDPAVHKEAAA